MPILMDYSDYKPANKLRGWRLALTWLGWLFGAWLIFGLALYGGIVLITEGWKAL